MGRAVEDPAHLGLSPNARLEVALEVEEADMADKLAVGLALDHPAAKPRSDQMPTDIRQAPPAVLAPSGSPPMWRMTSAIAQSRAARRAKSACGQGRAG